MPQGIVEWRIHQDDIGAVGGQANGGEGVGGGCNVQHDDIGRDRIRGGVAAGEIRKPLVDLNQSEFDSGHASGDRKPGGADAGAEINHPIP